jgi:hypothetical protein
MLEIVLTPKFLSPSVVRQIYQSMSPHWSLISPVMRIARSPRGRFVGITKQHARTGASGGDAISPRNSRVRAAVSDHCGNPSCEASKCEPTSDPAG